MAGRSVAAMTPTASTPMRWRPVRDARPWSRAPCTTVILRLLGYLCPIAVTLSGGRRPDITLASLVPPYLAGYVIDRVVRPARKDAHGEAATTMAWLAVSAMAVLYIIRQRLRSFGAADVGAGDGRARLRAELTSTCAPEPFVLSRKKTVDDHARHRGPDRLWSSWPSVWWTSRCRW